MILSMTGFAAATSEMPGISLAVELRSVNHRYLDVTIKLPDELRTLETTLRERLAAAQKRGKLECRVALARTVGAAGGIAINVERVQQLAAAAAGVARVMPGAPPLTTADVMRWPGVIVDATISPETLAEQVETLVQTALGELTSARAREGAKLRAVLDARCVDIESQLTRVAPRIPALHAAYMEKLGGRLREAGLEPSDDRLKQELALFATRIDVAEEVARLTTHVGEVRRVLAQGGSVGKRLDFLAQELHREANTLGSKSVDAELSQVSLAHKVFCDQWRVVGNTLLWVRGATRWCAKARRARRRTERRRPTRPSYALHRPRKEAGNDDHHPESGCIGLPVRRRRAVRRRQEQHGQCAAGAGARHPALGVVYDPAAAARRVGGPSLPLRRRPDVPRAQGQR
jgi:uncharacterized protein (TIGR00255 family)